MGSMSRLETMRKVIAMILIIVICFTLIDASAFAGVSEMVRVEFLPRDNNANIVSTGETVQLPMGSTASFDLKTTVSATSAGIGVDVRIKIPESLVKDANNFATYFEEFPGDTNTFTNEGMTYTLEKQDGMLYLTYSLPENEQSEGKTVEQTFNFSFPNGVIQNPQTVYVDSESDITITTTQAVDSEALKKVTGGTMVFTAEFAWENVILSQSTDAVTVNGDIQDGVITNGRVNSDITYEINNNSLNYPNYNVSAGEEKGNIFTAQYTINDTITLPDYLTFPSGTVSISSIDAAEGLKWEIYVNTAEGDSIKIADVMSENVNSEDHEVIMGQPTLSEDGKNLGFAITVKNLRTSESSAKEVSNPIFRVKLIGTSVSADVLGIKTYYEGGGAAELYIENHTEFVATSLFNDSAISEATVQTKVDNPQSAFSVTKGSDHPYVVPGKTEITYTINIKNESIFAISKKNFTVTDELSAYVEYVPGSAVLHGYDEQGDTIEIPIDDSFFKGNKLDYTANLNIPLNKSAGIEFKVKVKGVTMPDKTQISNEATVQCDGNTKISNKVQDTYYAGTPGRTITKAASMVGGKSVIAGNTASYEIVFSNNSGQKMPFTIIDEIPEELDADSITSAVVYYSWNGNFSNTKNIKKENWTKGENASTSNKTFKVTKNEDETATINFGTFKDVYAGNYPYIKIVYNAVIKNSGTSIAGKTIKNTVYINEEKSKSASATLTGEAAVVNVGLTKRKMSDTQYIENSNGIYKLPYEIKLTNFGKDYDAGIDGTITVTDIMSGGLMPAVNGEDPEKNSGTITGTLKTGSSSETITGQYTRTADGKGGYIYTIKWSVNRLEKDSADSLCQTAYLTYDGYADSSNDITQLSNRAWIKEGEYVETNVSANANISFDKTIYSINDVITDKAHKTSADIYSGDKVVYQLTVKNTGNLSAMNCTINDIFPKAAQIGGEIYYSLYDEETGTGNVKIIGAEYKSGRTFDKSSNGLL